MTTKTMSNAEKFSKACDAIEAGGSEEQFREALKDVPTDILQQALLFALNLLVQAGRATEYDRALIVELEQHIAKQAENRNRMIAMSDEWLNEDPEPEQAA